MKNGLLGFARRMKQIKYLAWFADLSFARRITICAAAIAVIASIAWGAVSFSQMASDGVASPSVGSGGEMMPYPETPGGEADEPGYGRGTEPGLGTDWPYLSNTPEGEEPTDLINGTDSGQPLDNNEEKQREGETTTTHENVHYPTWIMDDIAQVSSGDFHTMAIKADSSLWAWGLNSSGQLGNGSSESQCNPVWIMDGVVAVSAGSTHTLAIRSDGSLWAWGENNYGQLGDGSSENRLSPVRIMDEVFAVSASSAPDPGPGLGHSMAIKSDGSLWAWGANRDGQLGDGTTDDRHSPVRVMEDVVAVAAADWSTIVIRSDSSLWIFRRNWLNEEGLTTAGQTQHKILDDVDAVSDCGSMAIKNDGSL